MKKQTTRPYTGNDLRQLIGIEDEADNFLELNHVISGLLTCNLNQSCGSFYTITDYTSLKYVFVSENIETITGHKTDKFINGGLDFMLTLSHPEEKYAIRQIHEEIRSFFNSLLRGERLNYYYCFIVRVKMANGQFIPLLCQFDGMLLRHNGHLLIGKEQYTEITHFDSHQRITLCIRHKCKTYGIPDKIYHYNHPKEQQLTRREREVLELVNKGLSSKQIADELNISINTTETHRRRISKKMKGKY